jgi:hypothetical protein
MLGRLEPRMKRWAFTPLLFLICAAAGTAVINGPQSGPNTGTVVGIAAAFPLAILFDYRRRTHRR